MQVSDFYDAHMGNSLALNKKAIQSQIKKSVLRPQTENAFSMR